MKQKWQYYISLFILSFVLVYSPVIIYVLYVEADITKLFIYNLPILFCIYIVIFWVISSTLSKKIVYICIVIIVLLNLFVIINILYNEVMLYTSIETNMMYKPINIKDIINEIFINYSLIIIISYILLPLLIVYKIKRQYIISKKQNIFYAGIFIICMLVLLNDNILKNAPLTKYYINYVKDKENRNVYSKGNIFLSDNISSYEIDNKEEGQIYVLVFGGCQNKEHYSLYGYQRNTNPLLNELKDKLYIYDNIYKSTDNKSIENLIALHKKAGFKTYYLSTKYMYGKKLEYYTQQAFQADGYMFANIRLNNTNYKEINNILVRYYDEIIHDNYENKFIIIHLSLSCENIINKNEESEYFYNKYATQKERKINEYDNTIVQIDYIVNRFIESLEISDKKAYMLFLGDTLQDEAEKEIKAIPFILWLSEEYKREYPETVQAVNKNLEKAYKVDTLMHSLTDLSQINYEKQDSSKSIFSTNYIEKDIEIDNKVVHKK